MLYRSTFGTPVTGASHAFSLAELKALKVGEHLQGERFLLSDGRVFYYHATSVLTVDDIFVARPDAGAGRYLLAPGAADIKLTIAPATADAAVLATVPTGALIHVVRGYWEVTTDWTGGSSSAIGLSSSQTGHDTKGDLHGGSGGDVAATLVASVGLIEGTIGANIAAGVILRAASTVRFDRVTSAFTAGAGFAHLICNVLRNAGA